MQEHRTNVTRLDVQLVEEKRVWLGKYRDYRDGCGVRFGGAGARDEQNEDQGRA